MPGKKRQRAVVSVLHDIAGKRLRKYYTHIKIVCGRQIKFKPSLTNIISWGNPIQFFFFFKSGQTEKKPQARGTPGGKP